MRCMHILHGHILLNCAQLQLLAFSIPMARQSPIVLACFLLPPKCMARMAWHHCPHRSGGMAAGGLEAHASRGGTQFFNENLCSL